MLLDLFPEQQKEQERFALQNAAPDLPIGFGEAFSTAINTRAKFAGSLAEGSNRYNVYQDVLDKFEAATGEALPNPEVGNTPIILRHLRERFEARRADIGDLRLPDEPDVASGAVQAARKARSRDIAARGRARGTGATAGFFLGDTATAVSDPVNIIGMGLGAPAAAGIVRTAVIEAFAAAASEAAIQGLTYDFKKEVDPNFGLGEAAGEVGIAAVGGGVLGGGIKGLATAWRALRGGDLPRHVRDAGNVVESEAQVAETNPFPDAAGDAKHAAALSKAVGDIQAGRPVDVQGVVGPTIAREGLADIPIPEIDDVGGLPSRRAADVVEVESIRAEGSVDLREAPPARSDAPGDRQLPPDLQNHAAGFDGVTIREIGPFGPVAEGFQGRWSEAVAWMKARGDGEAAGALEHPEIGPIDVFWGRHDPTKRDGGVGLAKIAEKHPEVIEDLPEILPGLSIETRSPNRVILASPDHRAVVRLDLDGQSKTWLMTAYRDERKSRRAEGSTGRLDSLPTDTSSAAPASGNIASAGPLEQSAAAAMRDMTPEQALDLSATPEAADVLAHRADNIQAAEPRPISVTRVAEDGTTSVETRDYHEMMREIDDEIRAADELKACVIGDEPGDAT